MNVIEPSGLGKRYVPDQTAATWPSMVPRRDPKDRSGPGMPSPLAGLQRRRRLGSREGLRAGWAAPWVPPRVTSGFQCSAVPLALIGGAVGVGAGGPW
jgi:hypothetical protein